MELYVLRHEERDMKDPLLFSPLTQHGFLNSLKLIKINEINPDIIYCSPFLRTIETIYPYCKAYNKKINIENSLYEYIHAKEFKYFNYIHFVEDLRKNKYQKMLLDCINEEYESELNVYDIKYPENYPDLYNRVHKFIFNLKKKINKKYYL